MSHTITTSTGEIVPDLLLGYDTASETRNIQLEQLDGTSSTIVVGDGLRIGILRLYFDLEPDAWAAYTALRRPEVFTFESDLEPLAMRFVRDGSMNVGLDSETLSRWLVDVGYREVPA